MSGFELKEDQCLVLLAIINKIPSLEHIRLQSIWNLSSSLLTCNLPPLIMLDNARLLFRIDPSCTILYNLAVKVYQLDMNSRRTALESRFYDNDVSVLWLSVSAADLPDHPF